MEDLKYCTLPVTEVRLDEFDGVLVSGVSSREEKPIVARNVQRETRVLQKANLLLRLNSLPVHGIQFKVPPQHVPHT